MAAASGPGVPAEPGALNLPQFMTALEKILVAKAGSLTPTTVIAAAGTVDSMAVLEIQALADEEFGLQLEPNAIGDCKTVSDLCKLVKLPIDA